MKKLALLACSLMCVLFITSTAFAKPAKIRHRGFDQVGRNGVNHSYSRTMRKAHRSSHVRRSSRGARYIKTPRQKGEIYGASSSRRGLSRSRSTMARARAEGALANKVKPAIRCADGVACGNSARSTRNPAARSKSQRSFLQSSDAQERRWKKIMKLHAEKWEPAKSKALKSGCHDFAQCM